MVVDLTKITDEQLLHAALESASGWVSDPSSFYGVSAFSREELHAECLRRLNQRSEAASILDDTLRRGQHFRHYEVGMKKALQALD